MLINSHLNSCPPSEFLSFALSELGLVTLEGALHFLFNCAKSENHAVNNSMVVTETRPEEHEDEDSLFGSPPPSPQAIGRPASPVLALPSTSNTWQGRSSTSLTPASASADIQNVGTIALPGSQTDSELPIHPLALSLNHGVPRPPALPQKQPQTHMQMAIQSKVATKTITSTSSTFHSSSSFVASASPPPPPPMMRSSGTVGKAKKRSRPSSSRSDSLAATAPALEFTMPDASAPPPAHFLRNQENLLGKAGLVAGINPARLTHFRGSTPLDPIVLDDEVTPTIGRKNPSKSREPSQPPIDLTKLLPPTNEEIVSVLIGQKDIFPVLESILKLIAKGMQPKVPLAPRRTGFERRSHAWATSTVTTAFPPVKKRKLNRVPAGASDWDVPFPFAEGEGPEDYQRNWEQDRGKQLVVELIKLIKIAARKAATKKYIVQQRMKELEKEINEQDAMTDRKGNEHHRPETAPHGRDGSQEKGHEDTNNACLAQHNDSLTTSPDGLTQIMPSLDEIFSSMKAQDVTSGPATTTSAVSPTSATSSEDGDQKIFDTWMNFLEAFPVQFGDTVAGNFGLSSGTTPTSTPPLSLRSTPAVDDSMLHVANTQDLDAMLNSLLNQPFLIPNAPPGVDINTQGLSSSTRPFDPSSTAAGMTSTVGGHLIDPTLLVASANVNLHSAIAMNTDTSQAASPFVSVSSLGGSQNSTTPVSTWDFSLPVILSGGDNEDGQGMWRDFLSPNFW